MRVLLSREKGKSLCIISLFYRRLMIKIFPNAHASLHWSAMPGGPAILGEWLVILMNVSSPIAFRFRRYVWRQQQALSQRFSILRPPLFPRTYLLRAGCG